LLKRRRDLHRYTMEGPNGVVQHIKNLVAAQGYATVELALTPGGCQIGYTWTIPAVIN
jgi:hypothetical protein